MSVPRNSVERKLQKIVALRKKPKIEEMEFGEREEEPVAPTPVWWEVAIFRVLNAIMVIFFLTATVKLQSDDNACLWIPAFLVPAFLSTVVALKPQLSGICTHKYARFILFQPKNAFGGRPG